MNNFNYDSKFDTLYVAVADKSNSYGDDSQNGILVMRDMDTEDVTGFTIMHFRKKYHQGTLPALPNGMTFPFEEVIKQI